MKHALQVVGVLALVAFGVGGAVFWKLASDGIQVHVGEAERAEGPDPLALLGEDLRAQRDDLRALTQALNDELGRMSEAWSADAAAANERVAALERELRALRNELARTDAGAASERLEAQVAELTEAVRASAAARLSSELDSGVPDTGALAPTLARDPSTENAPAAEVASSADPADPTAAAAELENAHEEPATERAPASALGASPQSARRGFLAFQLPSESFRFEGRQRFRILADLSRVGFDAKSTLHDFSGVSESVRGEWRLDLAHPDAGIEGELILSAKTLSTALEGRDEEMHKLLDVEAEPEIRFAPSRFEGAEVDAAARTVKGTVHGRMTIAGTTRDVAMPVRGTIDESLRLVVEGEMPLSLSEFELEPPSKLGMIKVEDGLRVWIHLRARALPLGAEDEKGGR